MKRNTHVFIPDGDFRLLCGGDNLACYQVCAVRAGTRGAT
jgi:hypothetical protein